MANKLTELEKLKNYLDEHGYVSRWNDVWSKNDQIIVYTENDFGYPPERKEPWYDLEIDGKPYLRYWDVVCHQYSYGGDKGLLEIYGSIVDDVEGWLTAEDVINKYLKKENNDG